MIVIPIILLMGTFLVFQATLIQVEIEYVTQRTERFVTPVCCVLIILRPLHEVASEGETRQKQAKNRSLYL